MSAIGRKVVFRLTEWSRQIHSEFHGLAATRVSITTGTVFSVTGLSPSPADRSRPLHLTRHFLTAVQPGRAGKMNPTTPHTQPLPGITCAWFSLIRFRSPLLTESLLFSLPEGTEMFHFPSFPPHRLYIQRRVTPHDWCWVSPFGNPRITARLTAPRGISQPPTSFIGSLRQGIHRAPLDTYNTQNTHQTRDNFKPSQIRCALHDVKRQKNTTKCLHRNM